jgi:alkylresorcinol/alkylpyrone synthase
MESLTHRSSETSTSSSATIAATATALPPHSITREDVKYYMGRVFDIPERRLEAMMSIVDNAQVHKRHSIFPINYTIEPRTLSQTNNEYIEHSVKLGKEAAEKCLERAGLRSEDIDLIITVSCTGFMIPSLDAHLINLMGFRSNVRRMPFTELGCAAGAMALSRAADFLKAHQGGNVLIVAVELPSLTFQRKDSNSVWGRSSCGGGQRETSSRAKDLGFGDLHVSRFVGSDGI